MEIILKQDISSLGYAGDIVKVKNGYGLNFLIPKGMAVIATPSNRKIIEENNRQAAHKFEKIKAEAEQKVIQLKSTYIQLPVKVGTTGKIFGSITSLQVSRALKELGFDVDRKDITFTDEIKEIGKYNIIVKLHKEISAELTINVVREEETEE